MPIVPCANQEKIADLSMRTFVQPLLLSLKSTLDQAFAQLAAPSKGRFAFFLKVYLFVFLFTAIVYGLTLWGYSKIFNADNLLDYFDPFTYLITILYENSTEILVFALILPFFLRTKVDFREAVSFNQFTQALDRRAYLLFFLGSSLLIVCTLLLWQTDFSSATIDLDRLLGYTPYYASYFQELVMFLAKILAWASLAWLVNAYRKTPLEFVSLGKMWPAVLSAAIFYYGITYVMETAFATISGIVIRPFATLFIGPIVPSLLTIPVVVAYNALWLMTVSVFVQAAFKNGDFQTLARSSNESDLLDDNILD
jgi:hypothetical protein